MNRLDKFVNDKLAQRAFEMDKNHWLQAAQLIDAQQKRRRRFFWIWFLSGQVLVLVLAFFLWPTFVAEKTATRSNLSPPLVQTNATAHLLLWLTMGNYPKREMPLPLRKMSIQRS